MFKTFCKALYRMITQLKTNNLSIEMFDYADPILYSSHF